MRVLVLKLLVACLSLPLATEGLDCYSCGTSKPRNGKDLFADCWSTDLLIKSERIKPKTCDNGQVCEINVAYNEESGEKVFISRICNYKSEQLQCIRDDDPDAGETGFICQCDTDRCNRFDTVTYNESTTTISSAPTSFACIGVTSSLLLFIFL
ncbi:uncharacterized protein [Watersipora subatra]|uniref:uncharacterized protein n=1 Tax=Watersipora subatra TaxID=2589382 RepID=UPI00355C2404